MLRPPCMSKRHILPQIKAVHFSTGQLMITEVPDSAHRSILRSPQNGCSLGRRPPCCTCFTYDLRMHTS